MTDCADKSIETNDKKLARFVFRSRAIDLAHLARYTKGNFAVEHELLGRFQRNARLYYEKMEQARDDAGWNDAARQLKTAAAGVGAWQIFRAAETAEQLPVGTSPTQRAGLLASLDAQIREASAFIGGVL